MLNYVETDLIDAMRIAVQAGSLNTSDAELIHFFEHKEMRLNAVLGDYGCFRFLERLKSLIVVDPRLTECNISADEMPYYLEFHLSTSLSMFRLWLKRGKDIPQERLFDLIHQLYTNGMFSAVNRN